MLHFTNNIKKLYYGNNKISKVFYNNNLVYNSQKIDTSLIIIGVDKILSRYSDKYLKRYYQKDGDAIIVDNIDVLPAYVGAEYKYYMSIGDRGIIGYSLNISEILQSNNINTYKIRYNIDYKNWYIVNDEQFVRCAGVALPAAANFTNLQSETGELSAATLEIMYCQVYPRGAQTISERYIKINSMEIIKVS